MPWLAFAVFAGSAYQANQQRKAADSARADAARESTKAAQMAEQQLAVQREQASIARERLNAEVGKNAEERARLDTQAKKMADDLEAQQREYAEQESQRLKIARRGGRRSLLSDQRLNSELGIGGADNQLGIGLMV